MYFIYESFFAFSLVQNYVVKICLTFIVRCPEANWANDGIVWNKRCFGYARRYDVSCRAPSRHINDVIYINYTCNCITRQRSV